METVIDDDRLCAASLLDKINDAARLLDSAAKDSSPHLLESELPDRIMNYLNQLPNLNSRTDAERLLEYGVSMWNSVIALDKNSSDLDNELTLTVVRLRHIACDAIMIAAVVLDCVSAKYEIDEVSMLKFYTTAGRKYMTIEDLTHAEVCFAKAMEFQESALKTQDDNRPKSRVLSKAIFELLLGRAECSWGRRETSLAETLVTEAGHYLDELVDEIETLANIQFNFGLYSYRDKKTDKAIEWLSKSMHTRELRSDGKIDKQKQATSARLIGACHISHSNLDDACAILSKAEELYHDPVGAYVLFKISVTTRDQKAVDQMSSIIADPESSLDLCLGTVALMADAQWQAHAVNGFKAVFERFESDSSAIIERIAPRYFEALTAVGKSAEALQLLDKIIALLKNLRDKGERDERNEECLPNTIASNFQRWSSIALAAGCKLSGRNDYAFATTVLEKAFQIAQDWKQLTGNEKKDFVLENEAALSRLLASCALFHASSQSKNENEDAEVKNVGGVKKSTSMLSPTRDESIRIAKTYATKAQILEPEDPSACLLLFRAHLLSDRPDLAAEEIRKASSNTTLFDTAGIAEAACYAQDNGDTDAVLTSLGCILNLPEPALRKNLIESPKKPQANFFGSVFVSYIKILVKDLQSDSEGDDNIIEQIEFCPPMELLPHLHASFEAGVRGTHVLGVDVAFGEDIESREKSLKFLADVSWNCGKFAGERDMYDLWESFFELSYKLNALRQKCDDTLDAMRIACTMSAVALIESGTNKPDDFIKANKRLVEVKRITEELSMKNDPIPSKILLIQAKCFIGMGALDELGYCADAVCQDKSMSIEDMQQLAMIYRGESTFDTSNTSESKARRNEMACTLLNCIVDRLLIVNEIDIADLALTLRELISTELARGELGNNALQAFSRAVGVVTENKDNYPSEEVRWLTAKGWDRAEMLFMVDKHSEAMRWADMAMEVAVIDKALQTYVPRIQQTKDRIVSASNNNESCKTSTPKRNSQLEKKE